MTESLSNSGRRCLLVSCHPLADSLCNHLVARVKQSFAGDGFEVEHLDLYDSDFAAPLSAAERRGYFTGEFDASALGDRIAALQRAEILVVVLPTWWFGLPALLKGWFDRLIVRRPLRRILKKALIGTCAPAARFDMLSLYSSMALEQARLDRFLERIDGAALRIIRSAPA